MRKKANILCAILTLIGIFIYGKTVFAEELNVDNTEEAVIESMPEEGADLEGNVAINATNFPDEYYRNYVKEIVDIDKNDILSKEEIKKVTYFCTGMMPEVRDYFIYVDQWYDDKSPGWNYNGKISNFKGIEYFYNLEEFCYTCSDSQAVELDLSQNKKIRGILLANAITEKIDYTCFPNLVSLVVTDKVSEIDVSQNPKLENLVCKSTLVSSLDLSKNSKLKTLICSYCRLNNLDLSNCPDLEKLVCSGNPLYNLDLSNNLELTELICVNCGLSELNLESNTNLVYLEFSENWLSELIVNSPALVEIICYDNELNYMDLHKAVNLKHFDVRNNQLMGFDISHNQKLTEIHASGNPLVYFDMSNNPNLTYWELKIPKANLYETANGEVNMSSIPGFDMNRMKNVSGATVSGTTIIPYSSTVTYSYVIDSNSNQMMKFTATVVPYNAGNRAKSFVEGLYTKVLGRSADAKGMIYWSEQLGNKKTTGAKIAYDFVFSKEYIAKNTTDEQFIKMLYRVFLRRYSDSNGLAYWKGLLDQGMSREYVFNGFVTSKEFKQTCLIYGIESGSIELKQYRDYNQNLTKFVTRIYSKAMNRKGDVDGLNYWCGAIIKKEMTPTEVAETFICSDEFERKNLNDEAYIKVLYRTFMDREADQAGLNYWIGQLNMGMSRRQVLKKFAGCPEFQNIIKSFGF